MKSYTMKISNLLKKRKGTAGSFMNKESVPYKVLCTEYYEWDKPYPQKDAF